MSLLAFALSLLGWLSTAAALRTLMIMLTLVAAFKAKCGVDYCCPFFWRLVR